MREEVIPNKQQESLKVDPRIRLAKNLLALSKEFYQRVLVDMPGVFPIVANSLLKSVPVIDFVTDGNLALARGIGGSDGNGEAELEARVSERVEVLPIDQVEATQVKLDQLFGIAYAIPFSTAQRLKPYLQVTLPETRDGLRVLKDIAGKVGIDTISKSSSEKLRRQLKELEDTLGIFEDEILAKTANNPEVVASVMDLARNGACVQLFEAKRRGDGAQDDLKRELVQKEISRLRDAKVMESIEGEEKEFSELDRVLYEIIDEGKLADRIPEARDLMQATIERRKAEAIDFIIRKRVLRKVAGMMLSDPLITAIAARLEGMTEEQMRGLKDDEGMAVRTRLASQLLETQPKKLARLGFSQFPNFKSVFEEEKDRLKRAIDVNDPFLFVAQLDSKEFELIRVRIPNIFRKRLSGDNRAIFALAREELEKRLLDEVSDENMEKLLAEKLFQGLLKEFAQETVDRMVQTLGINTQELLANPLMLFDFADQLLATGVEKDTKSPTITVNAKEPSQPTKSVDYEFTVPQVTTGKCQLVSPESLLKFGTALAPLTDLTQLGSAIALSEFAPFFEDPVFKFYPPERKLEMIFSIVGRGAGSKLAGSPLFELKDNFQGLVTPIEGIEGTNVSIQEIYGTRTVKNSVRLSSLVGTIGQPFSRNLPEATRIITQAIDTVSANLETTLQASGKSRIGVEEATELVKASLSALMREQTKVAPGREVLQMDFFLVYPSEIRKRMIETFMSNGNLDLMRDELAALTRQGEMRASVFDISGGSGGVGITEFLSQRILGRPSGHMNAYMDAIMFSAGSRLGRTPANAVIAPRQADMTLMNFEYLPAERALRERVQGEVGISTLELLQSAIEANQGKLAVPTLKGNVIEPDTIVKRFTFPNEGKGAGYRGDIFVRMPEGVVMTPPNSSRIVASDKRVNLKIVEMLKNQLVPLGIDPIPFLDLDLRSGNFEGLSEQVVDFMVGNRAEYPEMDFFGAVVKTGDKIPGREKIAGEVISAYPIPSSVMVNDEMRRAFIVKKLRELYLRGVSGVIIQPNILSLVADNNGNIAPKFEVKMIAFAKPKRS